MNAEIVHRLEESFKRTDQEKSIPALVQQAASTAAMATGLQIIKFLRGDETDLPNVSKPEKKDKTP
jgi:hypothetical protein